MVTSSGGVGAELGEDCAVEVCRRRDPLGGGGVEGKRLCSYDWVAGKMNIVAGARI